MRAIDVDKAKRLAEECWPNPVHRLAIDGLLDMCPIIDPKDLQPHGKNITLMHPSDEFVCSICRVVIQDMIRYDPEDESYCEYEPKFCPNCGAKMDEDDVRCHD